MSYKSYCNHCAKNVPLVCGDCEMPVGTQHKCSECGSFVRVCAICKTPAK